MSEAAHQLDGACSEGTAKMSRTRRRRGERRSKPPIDNQWTHLKIRPILNNLRFGGDAAENDDNLEAYFIETSSFLDVASDEADLILGPKGSGKTAIFRRIANPDVEIKQIQDVDIVPAFNIQGSVFFQRLTPELSKLDEALLRTAWMAYVLGIVGNHLVDTYGDILDTQPLEQTLTRIGLRARQDAPKSLWTVIASSLRRFSNPTAVETSLTFGESGVPILTGKAQYDRPSQSEGHPNEPADLEDLLSEEVGHFQRLGRRCWVMFDRLDEAFQHDRDLERAALKGLLRAHLDICSYGTPLRTKLFLRTDILHRVTEGSGFVNATHIRTQRISWDIKSIVDLVTKRIVGNETFRTTFEIEANETASEADRRSVVTRVLPAKMENLDIFSFMIQRTVDASDEPNPRNVITLLRLARQSQLRICDRDDPEYGLYGSLIGQDAMKAAMKELSSTRLEDTLFAEFHQLRPYVEKLKGRSFIYTREELAGVLSLSPNGDQFNRLVENLKYSGFMRE
jgi:hypothetical protein